MSVSVHDFFARYRKSDDDEIMQYVASVATDCKNETQAQSEEREEAVQNLIGILDEVLGQSFSGRSPSEKKADVEDIIRHVTECDKTSDKKSDNSPGCDGGNAMSGARSARCAQSNFQTHPLFELASELVHVHDANVASEIRCPFFDALEKYVKKEFFRSGEAPDDAAARMIDMGGTTLRRAVEHELRREADVAREREALRNSILARGYDLEKINHVDVSSGRSRVGPKNEKLSAIYPRLGRSLDQQRNGSGQDTRIRYRDGQPVSFKGEKVVVEKKASDEWDGGSRGKVYTKGKRGKGFV